MRLAKCRQVQDTHRYENLLMTKNYNYANVFISSKAKARPNSHINAKIFLNAVETEGHQKSKICFLTELR